MYRNVRIALTLFLISMPLWSGSRDLSLGEQLISLQKRTRDEARKKLRPMHFGARKKIVPVVAQGLRSPDYQTCNLAAFALGEIGTAAYEALPEIIDTLKNREDCPNVVFALKKIGRPAVPYLIQMLKDEDSMTRDVSSTTLIKMGAAAQGAIPALREILEDMDEFYGIEYVPYVARIQPKEVVPYLSRIISQGEYPIRKEAAALLAEIGPDARGALPQLINALKIRTYFVSEDWRPEVARALGNIGAEAKDAVPLLIKGLKDSRKSYREAAAQALEKIGTPRAKSALKNFKTTQEG